MKRLALLLALTPLPSSAGIFDGFPSRLELPRLSLRSLEPPAVEASAGPSTAPHEGSGGSKNDNAAAHFAAKMDGHPGMALQMEARRKAEAQMKVKSYLTSQCWKHLTVSKLQKFKNNCEKP